MATFQLSIVTAKGMVFEGQAESVMLPGADGQFGVLANHAPLIGALELGIAKVTEEDKETYYMVGDGYVDVAHNEVSVIVGEAAEVESRFAGEELLRSENPWDTLDSVKVF